MICPNYNDPKVREEFGELKDVFGENIAHALWQENGGWGMEFDRLGDRSSLFAELTTFTGNRADAMRLKALIHGGKPRFDEPGFEDFMIEVSDSNLGRLKTLGLQEHEMNPAGVKKKLSMNIRNSLLNNNVIVAAANAVDFVYSDPKESYRKAYYTMKHLNRTHGGVVAALDTSKPGFTRLVINPNDALVREHHLRELQLRAQKKHEQFQDEFMARDRYSNERLNDEGDIVPYADKNDLRDYMPGTARIGLKGDIEHEFSNIIDYYKGYLERVSYRLKQLRTQKKNQTGTQLLYDQIAELQELQDRLQDDIRSMSHETPTVPILQIMAKKDFARVEKLLEENSEESLNEAGHIIAFYKSLGMFGDDQVHNALFADLDFSGSTDLEKDMAELRAEIDEIRRNNNGQDTAESLRKEGQIAGLLFEKDVKDAMSELSKQATAWEQHLNNGVKQLALEHIKSHPHYSKLYEDDLTIEKLFERADDISWIDSYFLGIERSFGGQDSIIAQIIKSIYDNKLTEKDKEAKEINEEINTVEKATDKELKKNGETYVDVFYQHNEMGQPTNKLVGRFSSTWYRALGIINNAFQGQMKRARMTGDPADIKTAYINKFQAMDKRGDWIKPGMLSAVKNDEGLNMLWASQMGTDEEIAAYEAEMKERLGEDTFNEIVAEQLGLMKEYSHHITTLINNEGRKMADPIVDDNPMEVFYALPEDVRNIILREMHAHSPFIPGTNQIDANAQVGTPMGYDVTHTTKYNRIIPKKDSQDDFDSQFDKILGNDIYLKAWRIASKAVKYVIDSTNDAGKKLTHNSFLEYKKSIWATFTDKNVGLTKRLREGFAQLWQSLRMGVTGRDSQVTPEDETKLSDVKFQSVEKKVSEMTSMNLSTLQTLMGREFDEQVTDADIINLDTTSDEIINYLASIAGVQTRADLIHMAGTSDLKLRNFVYNINMRNAMHQQNTHMFKALKYHVGEAAGYAAGKEILPLMRVLKGLYEKILPTEKEESGSGVERARKRAFRGKTDGTRENANKRMQDWFDRVVRGYYGVKPALVKRLGKVYSVEEKKRKTELEIQRDAIKPSQYASMERQAVAISKKESLQKQIDDLGSYVDAYSALGILQTFIIVKALAYNFEAAFKNYLNGYFQNKFHDENGSFWTPGNYDKAFSFLHGKGRKNFYRLASINGLVDNKYKKHAQQIEIAEMFFYKIGLHNDVRNEKQKAGIRMGKESLGSKFKPLGLSVTAVEWRNQGGTILSVLMDQQIKNVNGETVKVFDGGEFNIYENVNGKLKLKEEFRTMTDAEGNVVENRENIENWERFDGDHYNKFRGIAQTASIAVHGDYSSTSGMRSKSNAWGRTFSIFKTWLPSLLYSRFGKGVNLAAGTKQEKAIYKRQTPLTAALMLAMVGGISMGGAGALVFGGLGAVTAIAFGSKRVSELSVMKEQVQILKMSLLKMMAIPANIAVGRDIKKLRPDAVEQFGAGKFTEEDAQAMGAITTEISLAAYALVMKYIIQAALSCDDEKNPACKAKMNAAIYLDNLMTGIFDDITIATRPSAIGQLLVGDLGPMGRIVTQFEQLIASLERAIEGEDTYVTGKDSGESRVGRSVGRLVLPGVWNKLGQVNAIANPEWKDAPWYVPHDKPVDYEPDWMNREFAPIEKRVLRSQQQKRKKYEKELEDKGFSAKAIKRKKKERYPTPGEKRAQLKLAYGELWYAHYRQWLDKMADK